MKTNASVIIVLTLVFASLMLLQFFFEQNYFPSQPVQAGVVTGGSSSVNPNEEGCTDTDGGFNIYTKGYCIDISRVHADYCSGGYLVEYFCAPLGGVSRCYSEQTPCPMNFTCDDGACTPSS